MQTLFRMPYQQLEKRKLLWIDKERMSGAALFYGTRVPIDVFLYFLHSDQLQEFHEAYPAVSKDQMIQILGMLSTARKRKPNFRATV